MILYLSAPDLFDHGLTQAAMRKLDQFSIRRNGKTDLVLLKKKHAEHRHMPAKLFSYRGLCDPGDLKHRCLK